MKQTVLSGLEPAGVFSHFEEICGIPHGSYHVEQLSDYLVKWAREKGLDVQQDKAYNVLIKKPASAGMENAPAIILQGHMDMVCEKERSIEHDFLKDGLKLHLSGDDITASGTTLGGDDGIMVAYAMAILEDKTLSHPALEVLITTQEEVGMEGAFAFDVDSLSGRYLINIDSEEEGVVLTSCAGGATLKADFPLLTEQVKGNCYEVQIAGLLGGHSGSDIGHQRANANLLMMQLLSRFSDMQVAYQLASLSGGTKTNAIPRECSAEVYISEEWKENFIQVCHSFDSEIKNQYGDREPEIRCSVSLSEKQYASACSSYTLNPIVSQLLKIPDGVYKKSEEMPDMIEASSNLGKLQMEENVISCGILIRSSKESSLLEVQDKISSILSKVSNVNIWIGDQYPGWEYKKDSNLRELLLDVYEKQYHKPMRVEAIHAGLECGIFASRKELDIISIGPDIIDIHTPKETLKVSSAKRTYELLISLLSRADELGI